MSLQVPTIPLVPITPNTTLIQVMSKNHPDHFNGTVADGWDFFDALPLIREYFHIRGMSTKNRHSQMQFSKTPLMNHLRECYSKTIFKYHSKKGEMGPQLPMVTELAHIKGGKMKTHHL